MITIGANGQKIAYGIKHYNLDTEADLEKLPRAGEVTGCTCFVISTSKYYMLNSSYEWIEITPFGKAVSSGSGGSGGGESGGEGDSGDGESGTKEDIVYEGGII